MKKLLVLFITCIFSCLAYAQHGKYVGGDISDLLLYEKHNSPYLDANGNKIEDLITWLTKDCGWNTFRVRLFVNPNGKTNDGKDVDPSVAQDLEYVKTIGKRIKDAGANFVLDFHYSDTWVDAGHIQAPEAWKSLSIAQKTAQIGKYTKECLNALTEAGAKPDMVQVGNEIMFGFMGIKVAPEESTGSNWDGFLSVLKAGCAAVRESCPEAKIIIHTDRPSDANYANYWYGKLDAAGVEYDIIGLSYYPFWHGQLSDLKKGLDNLKTKFPNKNIQIVETAYYFQYWPTSGINYDTRSIWAVSPTGQYNFVKDLIATLANYDQVDGLYYWCPEDAGNGDDTDWNKSKGTVMTEWTNRGLWDPNSSKTGHKIISCPNGNIHNLLKTFLGNNNPEIIEQITAEENLNAPKYNLFGQKITEPKRGEVYIQNGKKKIK